MPKKEETEIRKKINKMCEENEYANIQQNRTRARSITVGTAFGGAIEVNMRGDFSSLWCILSPVEAVEILEQLAAAAGVQVAIRPKDDFSAWRGWDVTNVNHIHWKGAAPWQVAPEERHAPKELVASEEPKQLLPAKEESDPVTKDEIIPKRKRTIKKRVKK